MFWADIAQRQGGVIARAQLRNCGLSDQQITRLASSGALVRQRPGTYLVRGAPLTYTARLWSAALCTGGVLGFATAAHLHGYDDRPDRIHVIRADLDHLDVPVDLRLHRVTLPDDVRTELNGLPITTATWTLLDHLGRLARADAYRLADRAIQRGWLRPDDIARRLREHPGRTGNTTLRLLLAHTSDGAAARSERILHRLLRSAGLGGWVPNYRVLVNGQLLAIVDVALVERRIAIEVDGWAYHSDVDRFQRDRQRQNALVALGWTVVRFTWADLTQRPAYVIRTLRDLGV
jgi:very-short-patch-repair endonuclease